MYDLRMITHQMKQSQSWAEEDFDIFLNDPRAASLDRVDGCLVHHLDELRKRIKWLADEMRKTEDIPPPPKTATIPVYVQQYGDGYSTDCHICGGRDGRHGYGCSI